MIFPQEFEIPDIWVKEIENADVLLLQREIPEHVNILAAKIAKRCA